MELHGADAPYNGPTAADRITYLGLGFLYRDVDQSANMNCETAWRMIAQGEPPGEKTSREQLAKTVRVGVEEFDSMGVGGLGFEVFGIQ